MNLKVIKRYRVAMVGGVIFAVVCVIVLRIHSTPFHVGSTPDEVWSYIHTTPSRNTNIVGVVSDTHWSADATTVKSDATMTWRGRPLGVVKTIYYFNDNTNIVSIESSMKFAWPFKSPPKATAAPGSGTVPSNNPGKKYQGDW